MTNALYVVINGRGHFWHGGKAVEWQTHITDAELYINLEVAKEDARAVGGRVYEIEYKLKEVITND